MKASELERKFGKSKQKTISELKHVISTRSDQNPNFCLFLGSGASRSSGIRTATEMVQEWRPTVYKGLRNSDDDCSSDEMKRWLTESESEWYDQDREYASLIERIYPLPTNRRKFIETEVADKIPSIGYAYLVRIAEAGLIRTIFTTNFDDLLNEAFYQFSSERALVCAHDSSVHSISITSRRSKIIKLHGDYLFDDIKNTPSETEKLDKNMRDKFEELLKEYGLIIAGYSGADKSIVRVLDDLLMKEIYLKNGLFWCFRATDEVGKDALDILSKNKAFYVITSGFDELMADIYTINSQNSTPFNSKLASDRASNIIDTYLQNDHLKQTTSGTIRKHLEALESDKNVSMLSDLMMNLNAERIASAGLTDKNMLVYLEIERALKERNPEEALERLQEELVKAADKKFKEILLHRQFFCSMRLNRFREARAAIKEILNLDPTNFYISLNECSLLDKREERVLYLSELRTKHPYSSYVLNEYVDELIDAMQKRDKLKKSVKSDEIIAMLNKSLDLDPSLDNRAWRLLFKLTGKQGDGVKVREALSDIVDKHLNRDAYSAKTSAMLFRFCRKFKTAEFKGKGLFTYLIEAYKMHFPRDYASHCNVFIDACIEFNEHRLLRPFLEEVREIEELKGDDDFAIAMMGVYYDVFRDLPGAIKYGKEFLRIHKKTSVEVQLLNYFLENKAISNARDMHVKLKGAIDIGRWLRLQAKIFEYEGRYQDAIDVIESIPDKRDFDEKYVSEIGFLELKKKAPARAVKICRDFLEARNFALEFEAEIINYEYGKQMDNRNIDKQRVSSLQKMTDSELVKAVCHSLLGDDRQALDIFRKESEKRFSTIDDCLRWPAISRLEPELLKMREELLKGRRTLTDLPKADLLEPIACA